MNATRSNFKEYIEKTETGEPVLRGKNSKDNHETSKLSMYEGYSFVIKNSLKVLIIG